MKFIIAAVLGLASVEALHTRGRATTTRYWDCSGGACGCGFGPQGKHAHCHSNAMFKAPAGNKYGAKYYGGAALSESIVGSGWLPQGCGKCYKLTGNANVGGHNFKSTVVLKATNTCPPSNQACSGGKQHFDIAAPGFDFPSKSLHNTCEKVEPGEQALRNPQTCAYWMIHSRDPNKLCNCNAFKSQILKNGCENFKSLYWANPTVDYEEVACPAELAHSPPCWHDNGGKWPEHPPAKCINALGHGLTEEYGFTPIEYRSETPEDFVLY